MRPSRLSHLLRLVSLAFSLFAATALPAAQAQDYDLIIRNGRVLDGTGAPAIAADVAIRGDRIVAIETKIPATTKARIEIDAAGRVVAPGFIDVHTHSENIDELPRGEN